MHKSIRNRSDEWILGNLNNAEVRAEHERRHGAVSIKTFDEACEIAEAFLKHCAHRFDDVVSDEGARGPSWWAVGFGHPRWVYDDDSRFAEIGPGPLLVHDDGTVEQTGSLFPSEPEARSAVPVQRRRPHGAH